MTLGLVSVTQADPSHGSYFGLDKDAKFELTRCNIVAKDNSVVIALVKDAEACVKLGGKVQEVEQPSKAK